MRQPEDIVGDYRLERAVNEGQMTRSWEAEQLSMHRSVMLEMLKAQAAKDERVVKAFLEDVRAKALVSHPGVGAVYEAVANDEATFFSRERLDGENLEGLYHRGEKFSPLEVVILLGQISRAMIYLEENKVATVDFALHHFILVGKDQVRIMNLAIEGKGEAAVGTRTKALLGGFFDKVIKQGLPGATRVKSLCGFMSDLERPTPVTWKQIEDLSQQVRDQLEGNDQGESPPEPGTVPLPKERVKIPPSVWALVGGVALIGGVILLMVFSKDKQAVDPPQIVVVPPEMIEIPAGNYGDREQQVTIREPFLIKRTEVTLAEYDAFLEVGDKSPFQHPEQPESKKDHRPDDWEVLWRAAVKGEEWQGRPMSLGCPVVGVDWWDAYAFATWKGGRLPTLKEWMAAAQNQGKPAGASKWGKVGSAPEDVTGTGVAGMAGSVREWTLEPEIDPDSPLAPKSRVAAGGSFEDSAKGILTRFWTGSRELRRSDLGFRLITGK